MIPRPRVVALLDEVVRDHPVTLVIGGAGTGKSLAVASWTEAGQPTGSLVTVSLDKGLRSPVRFWRALWEAQREVFGQEDFAPVGFPRDVDGELVDTFTAGRPSAARSATRAHFAS